MAKTEAPEFVIEDHGAPHLEGSEPDKAASNGAIPDAPAAPAAPGQVILEETWSAEEAQAFLHNIWNLGFWFYGVDWLAQPFDFQRSSSDAAWVLDRLLPKSMGGAVGWTIKVSNIASDIGMSVGLRREIIKRGPRSPGENMAELQKRYGMAPPAKPTGEPREEPAPEGAAQPAPKTVKPEPVGESDGDHFAFSRSVREQLNNFPDGSNWTDREAT